MYWEDGEQYHHVPWLFIKKEGSTKEVIDISQYVPPSSDSWNVAADFGGLGTEEKQIRRIAELLHSIITVVLIYFNSFGIGSQC